MVDPQQLFHIYRSRKPIPTPPSAYVLEPSCTLASCSFSIFLESSEISEKLTRHTFVRQLQFLDLLGRLSLRIVLVLMAMPDPTWLNSNKLVMVLKAIIRSGSGKHQPKLQ